jgi:hypothetical protein
MQYFFLIFNAILLVYLVILELYPIQTFQTEKNNAKE